MSLQQTFEVTSDDVQNAVFQTFDKSISWEQSEDLLDLIDVNSVSADALRGNSIDEQTNYAVQSISEQLLNNPEAQSLIETF